MQAVINWSLLFKVQTAGGSKLPGESVCAQTDNDLDLQILQCKMNKTKMVTIYSSPLHYRVVSPTTTETSSL